MHKTLPELGMPWDQLKQEMIAFKSTDIDWQSGKTAVYVFHPGQKVLDVTQERNLWLHVDACVGGYVAPFIRDNGVDVPPYSTRTARVY